MRSQIRRLGALPPAAPASLPAALAGLLLALALALPLAAQAAAGGSGRQSTPGPPLVSTGSSNHVDPPSAVLQGSVDPRTLATTYYFQYGPTSAYGSQTAVATLPAGSAKVKVAKTVIGVQAGYHYRLVASNADGTSDGHDRVVSSSGSSGKPGFELPKTYAAIPLGGTFVLTGALTGAGNGARSIVLQESPYPYTRGYADVGAPILTTSGGRFAFSVPDLKTSAKFRVATVGDKPLYSPVVPQRVSVRVALKVRSSRRTPGLVRLYGTVTPAETGAHVYLQLEQPRKHKEGIQPEKPAKLEKPEKGNKSKAGERAEKKAEREKPASFKTKFTTVVKHATRSISRFSVIVKVQQAGRYRAYVQVRPGALVSGTSQSVQLRAAPSAKKDKQKRKRRSS
ncbi:MAG TPA: hypothetical protein VL979_10015 [Solirubrobacteraceae bacterium]|nr:hypothetical protein [Solirubrobacteraceae bacterium]